MGTIPILTSIGLLAVAAVAVQAEGLAHTPLVGLPPIVENQIFDDNWSPEKRPAASERLTAVLARKFPTGTSEVKLRDVLLKQHFKFLPGAQPGCIPHDQVTKLGPVVECPQYDPARTMNFEWRPHELPLPLQAVCGQRVAVSWTAVEGKIKSIKGSFGGECV